MRRSLREISITCDELLWLAPGAFGFGGRHKIRKSEEEKIVEE
jgi:hypothetical protein